MEFVALFMWLCLCLLLGGIMHFVTAGASKHRVVRLLAAPGLIIRKFTMTLVALVCGGTVTRVGIYDLSSRDIEFEADGMASGAKVLVPLAPLFGGAVALLALNAAFGRPLDLHYSPPSLSALNSGGIRAFLGGTWTMLSSGVRQVLRADWGSARLYVFFTIIFSLALGACAPMERVKEAILGAALLTVALALLSSVSIGRGPVRVQPAWISAVRTFVISTSGVAFIMMVYGMLGALVVGIAVRIFELISHSAAGRPAAAEKKLAADAQRRRAA